MCTMPQRFHLKDSARDELVASGYPSDALELLDLMPLVMTAWADGTVSVRERDVILDAILRRGVPYGHAAYRQFVAWLAVEPPDALFQASLRAISAGLSELLVTEREHVVRRLLDGCERVAAVARAGLFDIGGPVSRVERRVLARITEALTLMGQPERAA